MIQRKHNGADKADETATHRHDENGISCFPGMLAPEDVVYDLYGYLWPVFKKYQYSYDLQDGGRILNFYIPSSEVDITRVASCDLDKIKQGYIDNGWTSCMITTNGFSQSAAISVHLECRPKKAKKPEK